MTSSRQRLGQRGEEIAKRRLESEGYRVLEANYRAGRAEIDIVAEQGGVLVFVEVRTRTPSSSDLSEVRRSELGQPEESITPSKQAHLVASGAGLPARAQCRRA